MRVNPFADWYAVITTNSCHVQHAGGSLRSHSLIFFVPATMPCSELLLVANFKLCPFLHAAERVCEKRGHLLPTFRGLVACPHSDLEMPTGKK